MKKSKRIRLQLNQAISTVNEHRSNFCLDAQRDYTRERKLNFETVIRTVLSMSNHSLQAELNRNWKFSPKTPTKSAFIQQRQKIQPEAFRKLFEEFTQKAVPMNLFKGYRLLACDSTAVNLPRNPQDTVTSARAKPTAESYNMLHLHAMYDLLNHFYTDYAIDYGTKNQELKALLQMAGNIQNPEKTILVADRGYGFLGTIHFLSEHGFNFILRTKDIFSNGFLMNLGFPDTEFDLDFSKILTCHQGKKYRDNPNYMHVFRQYGLDFSKQDEYPLSFRICRFKLPSGNYECLVTNLPRSGFSVSSLMKIYSLRWGIETSFRELKYSLGLMYFHAKKLNSVLQEIHAAMLMMNFCSLIVYSMPFMQKTSWKYAHKINFATAVGCCKSFLNSGETKTLDLILFDQSLIRPNRRYDRYLHDTKPAKSLTYRVS